MRTGREPQELLFRLTQPRCALRKHHSTLLHAPLQRARTRKFISHWPHHLIRRILPALSHPLLQQRLDGAPDLTILGTDQISGGRNAPPAQCGIQHCFHDLEAVALHAEDLQHVDRVGLVLQHRGTDGPVVLLLLADREVPRGVDTQPIGARQRLLVPEVLLLEVHALVGDRVLLVQGRPDTRLEVGPDALERLGRIPVFMKTCIFGAQQGNVGGQVLDLSI